MRAFSVLPELKVGTVVEVAGDAIRIEIDSTVSELTRTHAGNVYPVGQCGSVLKLHSGRQVLFAYVRMLRMRSEIAYSEGSPPPPHDARIIEANLFAEGEWSAAKEHLNLSRGVSIFPLPGQAAYLTTLEELSALYGAGQSATGTRFRINLGSYVGATDSTCYADLDKLIGLHSAVLGSTGSGKSGTVASILHSLMSHVENASGEIVAMRPRVVLIDPHGEYANAFKQRCCVFRAYSGSAEVSSGVHEKQLRLPYWLMSAEEFRDLLIGKTEWEATSENNIVLKSLRHSRLVGRRLIEPTPAAASRVTDWRRRRLCHGRTEAQSPGEML